MLGSPGPMTMRALGGDPAVTKQRIKPGTVRKIFPYAKPYRWGIALLLLVSVLDAIITASSPLLLKFIVDNGIVRHDTALVLWLATIVAGLAILDAFVVLGQRFYSSKIGEGLIYDLRTKVFRHIQQQPIAFFTRTQTGSLVSRLNTDVIEAQQAISSLLTMVVSSLLSLVLVLAAMFYLSWQVTVVALILIPTFLLPARLIGRRLQRFTRESMQLNAEMSSLMNERFNVAGAMLVKLYGRRRDEDDMFGNRAARVRNINVLTAVYGRVFFIAMTLLASLATALVYGLGGAFVINGTFQIGTLVALAALLTRLYGPINQLSTVQISVLTALVSFDRVFEVLDLKPLVAEREGATALPAREKGATAPEIEFDEVAFRYPVASEVSLASLESIALPSAERSGPQAMVLENVDFTAPAGRLTALVGPSGAGKTTITHLVTRLYDPLSGAVRLDGHDLRDLTLESLHGTIGVVTQDAHMFHETIRGNLSFARPDATDDEVIEACRAAQIWDLISSLPDGLDTVVGDRGYRLSGGEKQRVALARLLLKAPSVVVLDEATAHLDSESEAAVQRALKTALAGRTSLVIAHRLSTIREADQILVIDGGHVRERGTHEELLARGGLYAELYHTQFARQATNPRPPAPPEPPAEPAPVGPMRKKLGGGSFSDVRGSLRRLPGDGDAPDLDI
jgi:ATP-binding cassette subfamily B protein